MVKLIQMLAVSLMCASGAARADEYGDGDAAARRGDYATALKLLSPLAQKGLAQAQFNLGYMYDRGLGVARDYKEALRWYRLAADQGLAEAQFKLGIMYVQGLGVAQHYEEAAKWVRLAAEQGDASAQYYLGTMYRKGDGVLQNFVHAHMWLNLAAASLSGDEGKAATSDRDLVSLENLSSEEISRAQEMARKCQESNFKNCD